MIRFRIQGLDDQKFQKFKIRIQVQSGSGSETPVMCQHIIFISMSKNDQANIAWFTSTRGGGLCPHLVFQIKKLGSTAKPTAK
jgi:hypothetical protein